MGALFGGAAILLAPVLATTSTSWLLTGRGVAVTAYLGLVTTVLAYLLTTGRSPAVGGVSTGPPG